MVAAARYADAVRRLPRRQPRLPRCRSRRSPTSPARQQLRQRCADRPRPTCSTGFTAGRAHAGRRTPCSRAATRSTAPTDGMVQDTQGLPGRVRPRPRRADLRRRARRHLPDARRRRPRIAPAVRRRDDEHRHARSTRASRTTPASATGDWAFWKFTAPPTLDAGAVGLHLAGAAGDRGRLQRPGLRARPATSTRCSRRVQATNATYTEIALSFMTPPNPTTCRRCSSRGAKMMVYHGTSDPIFSSDDTAAWYEALRRRATAATRRTSRASSACPA